MSAGNTTWFEARSFASPDSLSAVAHYVDREYGSYGYRVGLAMSSGAIGIFEIRHSDGSAFNVCADMWGNVRRIPDGVTQDEAEDFVRAMRKNAATA